MLLRPDDLENWLSDPEDWFNLEEKESDQWEYEIRVWTFFFYCHFPSLTDLLRLAQKEF
jgi:hypothetical protein